MCAFVHVDYNCDKIVGMIQKLMEIKQQVNIQK